MCQMNCKRLPDSEKSNLLLWAMVLLIVIAGAIWNGGIAG